MTQGMQEKWKYFSTKALALEDRNKFEHVDAMNHKNFDLRPFILDVIGETRKKAFS